MGRKKRTIEQVAKELKIELPKPKCFKVADIRQLEKQVMQEEISYSRMVEIMNEMADKFYRKPSVEPLKEYPIAMQGLVVSVNNLLKNAEKFYKNK